MRERGEKSEAYGKQKKIKLRMRVVQVFFFREWRSETSTFPLHLTS